MILGESQFLGGSWLLCLHGGGPWHSSRHHRIHHGASDCSQFAERAKDRCELVDALGCVRSRRQSGSERNSVDQPDRATPETR